MTGDSNKWAVGQSVWIFGSVQSGETWCYPAKIVEIDESGIIKAETKKEQKSYTLDDNKHSGISDYWFKCRHS